jgi:hypothetical protein
MDIVPIDTQPLCIWTSAHIPGPAVPIYTAGRIELYQQTSTDVERNQKGKSLLQL